MKRIALGMAGIIACTASAVAANYDLELRNQYGTVVSLSNNGGTTQEYVYGYNSSSSGWSWTVNVMESSDPYHVGFNIEIRVNGSLYLSESNAGGRQYNVYVGAYQNVEAWMYPHDDPPGGGGGGDSNYNLELRDDGNNFLDGSYEDAPYNEVSYTNWDSMAHTWHVVVMHDGDPGQGFEVQAFVNDLSMPVLSDQNVGYQSYDINVPAGAFVYAVVITKDAVGLNEIMDCGAPGRGAGTLALIAPLAAASVLLLCAHRTGRATVRGVQNHRRRAWR